MAAIDPNIIRDAGKLISLYQTNVRFRTAFDKIVTRNINATYQGRPVKLYVEVLANINSGYKQDYNQVRRIALHDSERKVGELFKKVGPHDFFLLDNATRAAEHGINNTIYSPQEIDQINQIETGTKNRKEKRETYAKREANRQQLTETPETPPTASQTLQPLSTPSLSEARGWSARIEKARQFISSPREYISNFFQKGATSTIEKIGVSTVSEGVIKTVSTRAGTRLVAGKAAAVSAGKIATKLGVNAALKVGAGLLVKLGFSALTGIATAGVGLLVGVVITLATTFGDQTKKLFKYIMLIVLAIFMIFFVSSSNQRGIKMNSLLPPYYVAGNVGIGTTSPPVIPPGGGSCPSAADIAANRSTTPENCRYLNPSINIFGDLTKQQLDTYIQVYQKESGMSLKEFTDKVNIITVKSRQVGLNPIIFLGYWKSESLFGDGFGCKNTPLKFEDQLNCAVGLSPGGSRAIQCAAPNSPYRQQGCTDIKSIIMAHSDIYDKSLFNFNYNTASYDPAKEPNPITTFDAIAEGHGPRSPNLSKEEGIVNNNCVHTYNILLEVANSIGACIPKTPGDLTACTFTRAGESKPYQSSKLLSYFQEISQKTSVPASLLGAITRVESTIPKTNTNGQGPYSLSDYSDSDIDYINNYINNSFPNIILTTDNSAKEIAKIVSEKIPGTIKSVCPVSDNNALGLMQIQPPGTTGHDSAAVNKGAKNINKTVNTLTLKDYCSIQSNLSIGAGFILEKLNTDKWDPKWSEDRDFLRELARRYYGAFTYTRTEGCPTDICYYGDDLYNSIQNCKSPTPSITPYIPPSGCIAAKNVTPPLNEYDYPRYASYQGKVWPMTCGPTSGAMVLQSTGVNASIADITNQWEADGAWSGSVGFYATVIPSSINKRYPDSLRAEYKTIKTVNQLKVFLQDSQNPIMISVYYENDATKLGLDKIQTAGVKGTTPGGIALTNSGVGHMIVVYQACDDRVYINDPIFGEQYSVPNSQFNQAISFSTRGEAVVVYLKK